MQHLYRVCTCFNSRSSSYLGCLHMQGVFTFRSSSYLCCIHFYFVVIFIFEVVFILEVVLIFEVFFSFEVAFVFEVVFNVEVVLIFEVIFSIYSNCFYSIKIRLETPKIKILSVAQFSRASLASGCSLTSIYNFQEKFQLPT